MMTSAQVASTDVRSTELSGVHVSGITSARAETTSPALTTSRPSSMMMLRGGEMTGPPVVPMESPTIPRPQSAFPKGPCGVRTEGMRTLDFPVFDADNHLYETEDAVHPSPAGTHNDLFRFVEINGRKKLVVRDRLTEFIPNPTFEVVAPPGAHMAFYAGDNPEGKSLRELTGEPMRSIPAFKEPGPRLELLDEQGRARGADDPDVGEPDRGAATRRS